MFSVTNPWAEVDVAYRSMTRSGHESAVLKKEKTG